MEFPWATFLLCVARPTWRRGPGQALLACLRDEAATAVKKETRTYPGYAPRLRGGAAVEPGRARRSTTTSDRPWGVAQAKHEIASRHPDRPTANHLDNHLLHLMEVLWPRNREVVFCAASPDVGFPLHEHTL